MRRRNLIGVLGAGMVGLAGCSSEDDEPQQVNTDTPAATTIGTQTRTEADTESETGTPTETQTETESETETAEPLTAEATIGEVVEGERLSMVVRNVSRTTQLGEFQQSDSGNTFVVIRLAVKNTTSDRFADFSGSFQTTLTDNEDFNYDPTLAVTDSSFQSGQLAPGEVSRGDIVFEVPKEASGLRLLFDFELFSFTNFEQVFIDLSRKTSPIGDLAQNLQVQTYGIGDAVEFQGTTTAVNGVDYAKRVGGDFGATADEGNTFAIIDISVTNETGEEQSVSTLLQMGMKDGRGLNYSLSLSATSELDRNFSQGSPIPDGETRRGRIAYEVPQSGTLYWTFEFSLFADGDKTFWQLR